MRRKLPLCGTTGKRRYPTQEAAIGQVIWLQDKGVDGFGLHVYHCEGCRGFHVGHLLGSSRVERAFFRNEAHT